MSAKGCFNLDAAGCKWRISPGQALLIPTETAHQISMIERCQIRVVFVIGLETGAFRLISLNPLLRELLFRVASLGGLSRMQDRDKSLLTSILHELKEAPSIPLQVNWPMSGELRDAAKLLVMSPLNPCRIADAARRMGMSQRTLERRFQKEVGIGVAEWRREYRLMTAAQDILQGATVSETAVAVGYASTSSFVFAFTRKFGVSPTRFRSSYSN